VTAPSPGPSSTVGAPLLAEQDAWPPLPLADWRDTYETLHLWTQIVGKTRLALAPMQNHWWQVVLYVTTRGLCTSPMPYGTRTVEIDFDFVDHMLVARTSDGATRSLPLQPQSVAEFYGEYMSLLRSLGIELSIYPVPTEMVDVIPFAQDRQHASYDARTTHACWRALVQADRVLKEFRGRFIGKCSPVHFWWGSFDLACTRFSGRRAPLHPGGIPNCPDYVTHEAYSHECISAGWWPGGWGVDEPAFYAYAYPEPAGCADATVRAAGAYYDVRLHEWILPYEAVRTAPHPGAAVMKFLQSTYDIAADLGGWDRAALERQEPVARHVSAR
jgi:hypothetical protein